MLVRCAACLLSVLVVCPSLARSEIPAPRQSETVWSKRKTASTMPDARTDRTHVRVIGDPFFAPWAFPSLMTAGYVSDHGLNVVEFPAWWILKPDSEVMQFWSPQRTEPIRVLLRDVVRQAAELSASRHVDWYRSAAFDDEGWFVVESIEGIVFRFDPYQGKPVNRDYFSSP